MVWLRRSRPVLLGALLLLGILGPSVVRAVPDVAHLLATARPGSTVALPAGTFRVEGLVLPPKVSLRGAGFNQTILMITGQDGISVRNARRVRISDLTIDGAAGTGISIDGSAGVTVSRVRVVRCLTGVMAAGSANVRLENVVAGENRTGIVLNGSRQSVVVNCSLVKNSALGLSLNNTAGCAAFNNVIAVSPIGVFVATNNSALLLDYNVYLTSYIGKEKDNPIPTVHSWRSVTRHDAHSVSLPITFVDESSFDYRPANTLNWLQDRAVTSGWGTPTLGKVRAPKADITGQPHRFGPCAGAYEVMVTAPRPADGAFTIRTDDGVKSAGLYDREGRNVAFLFNTLPLRKGTYPFWLPARNWQGETIAAGQYELRVSEANLKMAYIGHPGNTAHTPEREAYASTSIRQVIYDSQGLPILALDWSESHLNLRGMDARLKKQRWGMPGGKALYGAASDGKGFLYVLHDLDNDHFQLRKVAESSGQVMEIIPGQYRIPLKRSQFSKAFFGLAVLNDTLYLADVGQHKLFTAPASDPRFTAGIDVPAPVCPVGDSERKLVWVLSERKTVLGLTPDGQVQHRFTPGITDLLSLAVRDNRLALTSAATGRIHLYDIADPSAIVPLRTIGTGDGPYGPMQPDRFRFQGATSPFDAQVAIGPAGEVAVVDIRGVKLFGPDGACRREFTGVWGQFIETGLEMPDGSRQLLEKTYNITFLLNPKTKTWTPHAYWKVPKQFGELSHFFRYQGKIYGVHNHDKYIGIARYDNYVGVPLIAFGEDANDHLAYFDDFSRDMTDKANWKTLVRDDGQPMSRHRGFPLPDAGGDIITVYPGARVRLLGLDARGVPIYDWAHMQRIRTTVGKDSSFTSPYDYKTKEDIGNWNRSIGFFSDGSFVQTVTLKTGNATGFPAWAGTDMAGFDPDGKLRWFQPFAHIRDVEGTKIVDDIQYAMCVQTQEMQVLDQDGMFLGVCNVPPELYWAGMWLDNIWQYTVYKGSDGKHYVVYGNFNDCTTWWMQVTGNDRIVRHRTPVSIDDATAQMLAGLPLPAPVKPTAPPVTRVKIARLAEPLTIDGSLEKWRRAVPTPQVIVTPETGGAGFQGPQDCSALIRLAYEGKNLYVQLLQFDNLVTMHQPRESFFQQDALEMSINSYVQGVKINVTRVTDAGEMVYVVGWGIGNRLLDPATAPRIVKVLENAREVSERNIIERIYGEDLSGCKVIVVEFMVPLDAETFAERPEALPDVTSGSTMYLGFGVDDNDTPGADLQKMLAWPATYSTFGPKEGSAVATFE
ncbi:MAG: right-handed parallel beta-helix repeat-containing protein [Armatimonadota bacterium]